ncbi:hypothetical protein [Bradyrhizobium sp. 170]|uniref:hypothetical protein n=1 Tax=Bradyrhizobium sp. 170 TaxID=2782641 RepID=UPI001FFE3546|nr:hypothetical protein [Bradyrhizobium sp. 170]UPK02015.1 hypothetical protein IVB05_30925 [Bradyrhizobium sp. 170]
MTKHLAMIIFGMTCGLTPSFADTLTVTVLNESNKGIRSRVVYKSGPSPAVLGDTDENGALTKEYSCKSGEVLAARPFDKGSYFESTDEPCQSKVTLRVLSRQTPKGFAINYRIEKINLPDGSPALITYKGFISTKTAAIPNSAGCAVDVSSSVQQQLYKIAGSEWTLVTRNEIDPSSLFTGLDSSAKSVFLPFGCGESSSRVEMLNADAAGNLSRYLATGNLSVPNSIQSLGLRY